LVWVLTILARRFPVPFLCMATSAIHKCYTSECLTQETRFKWLPDVIGFGLYMLILYF
jgi:hypothetical protein